MQHHGTVIVTFYSDITEEQIKEYLRAEKSILESKFDTRGMLDGVKISQFKNRYAIEVPAEQEEIYVNKFEDNVALVESVNPFFLKGVKTRYKPKKKDSSES